MRCVSLAGHAKSHHPERGASEGGLFRDVFGNVGKPQGGCMDEGKDPCGGGHGYGLHWKEQPVSELQFTNSQQMEAMGSSRRVFA